MYASMHFKSSGHEGQLVGVSSVSLTADSSLCGGSLLAYLHAKPPLKGEVPAKRAEGFRLPAPQGRGGSVSRRDHYQVYRRATALSGGTTYAEAHKPNASRSSGERGLGGEALLSEKRPLPPASPCIVSSGGSAREGLLSEKPPPSHTPARFLFPAALRERGSGGEALLSEKRPLPQKLHNIVYERIQKASPERGGAREAGGGVPFPHAARSRRLCQPP